MGTGRFGTLHQCCHPPAERIKHVELHITLCSQVVTDDGGRVERIRIVLLQGGLCRQLSLVVFSIVRSRSGNKETVTAGSFGFCRTGCTGSQTVIGSCFERIICRLSVCCKGVLKRGGDLYSISGMEILKIELSFGRCIQVGGGQSVGSSMCGCQVNRNTQAAIVIGERIVSDINECAI